MPKRSDPPKPEALYTRIRNANTFERYQKIVWQDRAWHFYAQVKNTLNPANLGAAVYQMHRLPEREMLVTPYVTPEVAERLKDMDIPFINTTGNAYVHTPPFTFSLRA